MNATAVGFTPAGAYPYPHAMPFFLYSNSPLESCTDINYTSIAAEVKGLYVSVSLLSMICSIFVAITIFYNEKLRIHPSKLIGYMCICEATSCYNALVWSIHPKDYICYFGLHYLFSWTSFGLYAFAIMLPNICYRADRK
jgi:hypothetical protein